MPWLYDGRVEFESILGSVSLEYFHAFYITPKVEL